MNQPRDQQAGFVSTDHGNYGNQRSQNSSRNYAQNQNSGTSNRGFASMSKAERTRIARMGGQASHGGGRSGFGGRRSS